MAQAHHQGKGKAHTALKAKCFDFQVNMLTTNYINISAAWFGCLCVDYVKSLKLVCLVENLEIHGFDCGWNWS